SIFQGDRSLLRLGPSDKAAALLQFILRQLRGLKLPFLLSVIEQKVSMLRQKDSMPVPHLVPSIHDPHLIYRIPEHPFYIKWEDVGPNKERGRIGRYFRRIEVNFFIHDGRSDIPRKSKKISFLITRILVSETISSFGNMLMRV